MAGNSYGTLFRITTFGESHGAAIGVVIDGCPAGIELDVNFIQQQLNRRRPGQSAITPQRNEEDIVEILSGTFEGKTTGAPLCLVTQNKDQRPADYEHIKDAYRPSHSDFSYEAKYGIRDFRGSGRASARETAARVMAGAVAQLILKKLSVKINAFVSSIGIIELPNKDSTPDFSLTETNVVRCPHTATADKMIALIEETKKQGDTLGGVISAVVTGVPVALGEPVFDKLHAELGKAMLSINAVKGFEIGSGFAGTKLMGSQHNDIPQKIKDGKLVTSTNHSGGIVGGISNGMDITFNVAFKPVSTLMQNQKTINSKNETVTIEGKGRHDVCVVPRAVPIVEAMAAIVLLDFYFRNNSTRI